MRCRTEAWKDEQVNYLHTSEDGLCRSDDATFVSAWNDAARIDREQRRTWVANMLAKGAQIVTPDDGWIDRVNHTVCPPCYADLRPDAAIGDLIALGGPERWRIVRVVSVKRSDFIVKTVIYSFDPDPVESS